MIEIEHLIAELEANPRQFVDAARRTRSDVAQLRLACAGAIVARRLLEHAFKAAGRAPPTIAELRRLSPDFCVFERVAPPNFVALIEQAAAGDDEALAQLDDECERYGGEIVLH